MKHLSQLCLLCLTSLILFGCGGGGPAFKPLSVSSKQSVLNVYFRGNFFAKVKIAKVFIDGKSIGTLNAEKYISVPITPGTHELEVIESLSLLQQATGGNKLTLNVQPGQQYYVRLSLRTSSVVQSRTGATHNAVFVPTLVDPHTGRQQIEGTTRSN